MDAQRFNSQGIVKPILNCIAHNCRRPLSGGKLATMGFNDTSILSETADLIWVFAQVIFAYLIYICVDIGHWPNDWLRAILPYVRSWNAIYILGQAILLQLSFVYLILG